MVSSKNSQKKQMKLEAKSQRATAKDDWKRSRKQQSRNTTIVAVGVLMGLEAVLMGMLSEWIFLAICCLLAFAALMSIRSVKGAAVVGAFVVGFSLYFTFLHVNTLLVLWPHVNDTDEIYINGVAHKWSHAIWLAYVIKNSIGVILMFLCIVLGIASIVPALKGNRRDQRIASPRTAPAGSDPSQNVVIETYPPHPGPVLLQTAPLGQATLLQPVGVAYVTNVPPPPGVPYHTLNVAERPSVHQHPGSPQFYTAHPQHPTSPQFQPQVPGYGSPLQAPQQNPFTTPPVFNPATAPPYNIQAPAANPQQQGGAYYQGA